MTTITVMDPVTRIEGHLKVEVTVDWVGSRLEIVDARATGTLFRGFETILVGREPTDAPAITERICGVCPVSHGMASVLALEAANGFVPPTNGRLLRNLVLGANFVQSHILHFYLLAAADFVHGPQKAPWIPAWDVDIRPDPRLARMVDHLVLSLEARRRAHAMGAVFGGRIPSPHAFHAGGFTAAVTDQRIREFRNQLEYLTAFIERVYLPDVENLAAVYDDHFGVGRGHGNLIAFGAFPLADGGSQGLFGPGTVTNGAQQAQALDLGEITEHVTHSWYDQSGHGLPPASGATDPEFPKSGAYSWLKAPRYGALPHEAGPLARMWVTGDYREGISVMDRHVARAREALKVAKAMQAWLFELDPAATVHTFWNPPTSGSGVGLTEAPRGALGHWAAITGGSLSHYQVITPTCWNASPRDGADLPGPMEAALVGTPITDAERPIEALRVIHSFDPCLSCAVHVMRPGSRPRILRSAPAGSRGGGS
ncbi:MAG TPA: nickel-dependent hydrogenase large subunit [Candidatus Sulfomarinibacteraceae bacterium]|nr:nickel-dependent hydrogenase large subunit [Candidatus Sulfomarinibacteraceae bacterium]